jgi:Bax protein
MPHNKKSVSTAFHLSGLNKFIISFVSLSVAGLYLAAGLDAAKAGARQIEGSDNVAANVRLKSGLIYASLPRYKLFGDDNSDLSDLANRAKALSGPIKVASAADLHDKFSAAGFSLSDIRDGADVPRVRLVQLPGDLSLLQSVKTKKSLFIRSMLPLVLQANERVRKDRLRLLKLMVRSGQLGEANRAWLLGLADRYNAKAPDPKNADDLKKVMAELKIRVDIVPPSLALAQGAEESGWGTSRFAIKGNAVFGQWTYKKGKGIVPEKRNEGAKHEVRAFDELRDSIDAYLFNLNTHRAYKKFRNRRAELRRGGDDVTGVELIKTLDRYSQRGAAYIGTIRTIMRVNSMGAFDRSRLSVASGEET